ncbi:MAG: hypothetical protein IKM67_05420 [Clostridia bacterium]|nr:hypothetical protein [Clostridia bacterium]
MLSPVDINAAPTAERTKTAVSVLLGSLVRAESRCHTGAGVIVSICRTVTATVFSSPSDISTS